MSDGSQRKGRLRTERSGVSISPEGLAVGFVFPMTSSTCSSLPLLASLPFSSSTLNFLLYSSDFPMNPGSASLLLEGRQSCDITTLWLPFKG